MSQIQLPGNALLCFSDAAWQAVSCTSGLGWHCTTQDGTTLSEGSSSHEVVGSALIAEALALKEAVKAAIFLGIQDMVCFSDSKNLISQITGNKSVNALQGILHDIAALSRSLNSIAFKFIPRSFNVVADMLAKEALLSLLNSPQVTVNNVQVISIEV